MIKKELKARGLPRIYHLLIHLVLIFFTIFFATPLVLTVFTSLKSQAEVYQTLSPIPVHPQWGNYIGIWQETALLTFFRNSVIVTLASVTIVLFLASLGAYAFARLNFFGKNALYYLVLSALLLPIHTIIIPLFRMTKQLGLLNNYLGLIGPYSTFGIPLILFILRNYFETIPKEIEDAARIEGCSSFGIYWRIILPLSKPALATVIIWQFMASWNEFLLALLCMTKPLLKTLPLAPLAFYGQYHVIWGKMFAALITISIPVLIVYLSMQKYFVKGLTAGALKQ